MRTLNFFVLYLLLHLSFGCDRVTDEWTGSKYFLNGLINKTLELIKPNLANIQIEYQEFETGPQEIGTFQGNFKDVVVQGLENFNVKIIDTKFLDINNLTIFAENFTAAGFYYMNGTLAFPLGKNDIHLYGDGEFSAELNNFTVSLKLKLRFENGMKVVKDLDIFVSLDKLKVYLKNLMDGAELEEVFNNLLNDVGITVFNYYKEPILSIVKVQVEKYITEMLNADQYARKPQTHTSFYRRSEA